MRRSVVSSFAIRGRVPVSQFSALRTSVRVMASADDPLAKVKSAIDSDKVVIFSKSWCPFCLKTKALFDQLGTAYTTVELDEMDDGPAIQDALLGETGQRTVPNVFVGGVHLGGNDDTQQAAASGKLQEMLGI
eukprot:CAMPEP_0119056842 /NCGR_PEP_ID=MMETSP1178-20130426/1413_1 /TAXON_ID=33656 /ORGANISM="unid sp, Strain CCMP2000" /LENGTH=132 /DNA_ID=CAMNT_0007037617 /DNA_START=71 /DNA_END=469 /DNA_ORIENTATION=-